MKGLKKLFAVVASFLMVMSLAATAVKAADNPTLTLNDPTGAHTVNVYQVFTGTPDGTGLKNLFYGKNAKTGTAGDPVSQTDMAALKTIEESNLTDEHEIITALTPYVDFTSEPIAVLNSTKLSEKLAPGYYVIVDAENSPADLADGKVYTNTLFVFKKLTSDLTINLKAGYSESKKKVDDVNDSVPTDKQELVDSADYDIGDTVPYTLTFRLPDNYVRYEKFPVVFNDDMSEGLTWDGKAKIYYGASDTTGTDITFAQAQDDPTTDTVDESASSYTNGKKWVYSVADLKQAKAGLVGGDVITIKYTATLNANAKIGAVGNPNKYNVEFYRNPNAAGEGKPDGETPEDVNIVFTYKTIFNKVDGEGNPLTGADFVLEKFLPDENGTDEYNGVKGTWTDVTTINGATDNHPTKATSAKDGVEDCVFTFSGIDAGVYRLRETVVPKGYTGIQPQIFTITAEHQLEADNPQLTALTGTDGAEFTLTPDVTAGSLAGDIENNSGANLPETGGMGTTIIYTVGGLLVIGAAIMLITKKRMAE